jgi:hypothetical protein
MNNYINSKINDNNQTINKKKPLSPTIGDAVKEAVETKKEVIMEGPTEIGDIADIEKNTFNPDKLVKAGKEIDREIDVSVDETIDSKIEINIKDPLAGTPSNEDRIIINQENSEATIATVTTIPAEKGVEVEVQTEVEVPVKDKDKDVESDLKVLVHSPNSTIEIPIISEFQKSTSEEQKERISNRFNSTSQQSSDKTSNEFQGSVKNNSDDKTMPILHYFEVIEKVQEHLNLTTWDITKSYMDLQNQTIDSLQSMLSNIFENTNKLILNNRAYCTKIPETYTRIALMYAENTITINKILNDMAFANANTFKNMINLSKENIKQ